MTYRISTLDLHNLDLLSKAINFMNYPYPTIEISEMAIGVFTDEQARNIGIPDKYKVDAPNEEYRYYV